MSGSGTLRRVWRGLLATTLLTTSAVALAGQSPAGAAPLVVSDLTGPLDPEDLVTALVGGGVAVSNITFTGDGLSAGTFSGGADLIGFDAGVVLGSGRVRTADPATADCSDSKGVEGPNQCGSNTTEFLNPGDPDLTELSGVDTEDATVLEFDFVPTAENIAFRYVFTSEEYREFANSSFNDTFAFFVSVGESRTNCARVPGTGEAVSINTINNGDPGGDPTPHNAHLFIDNEDGHLSVEPDGLTVVLTCTASVIANETNHLKLAIADGTDAALDSNVFLQGGSLVAVADISTVLTGGDQSGASITVPLGTPVSDQAFVNGDNAATAGGDLTYYVFAEDSCDSEPVFTDEVDVTGGVAAPSAPFTAAAAGTYYWVADYSGDEGNDPASSACGDEILTVVEDDEPLATTLTYNGETAERAGNTIEAAGTLVDENGAPVVGVPVTFTVVGGGTCTATTSTTGAAACSIAGLPGGVYTINSIFAGNDDYLASSDSDKLTITNPTLTGRATAVAGVLPLLGPLAISDTGPVTATGPGVVHRSLLSVPLATLLHVSAADTVVLTRVGGSLGAGTIAGLMVGVPGLPVIRAWGVASWSATDCIGSGGTASIALLQIGTQRINVNTSPNTKINLGLLTITVNEQVRFTTPDGGRGMTVSALHIQGLGLNLYVASSTSDIHGCPTRVAGPAGAAK